MSNRILCKCAHASGVPIGAAGGAGSAAGTPFSTIGAGVLSIEISCISPIPLASAAASHSRRNKCKSRTTEYRSLCKKAWLLWLQHRGCLTATTRVHQGSSLVFGEGNEPTCCGLRRCSCDRDALSTLHRCVHKFVHLGQRKASTLCVLLRPQTDAERASLLARGSYHTSIT